MQDRIQFWFQLLAYSHLVTASVLSHCICENSGMAVSNWLSPAECQADT